MGYPARAKLPTQTATVTVAYVNERREGQFSASIKDTKGDLYWVDEDDLQGFKKDETYEIDFTVTQSKNGFLNRNVENFRHPMPSESSEDRAAQKVAQTARAAQPSQPVVREVAARDPMEPDRYGYPTHPRDAIRMWCCALIQKDMERGNVAFNDEEAVVERVEFWKRVWHRALSE